jgi:hypothetical protein
MNRKSLYLWIMPLAAIAFASNLAACGDDDSPPAANGGTGGMTQATPARVACEAFCVKEDKCDPDTTVDDCKMYRCGDLDSAAAPCQTAIKAYYDCANGLTDPCATAMCESLETLYHQACG